MQLTYGAATDQGQRRSENEDSFLVDVDVPSYPRSPALFVVCDGVGGAVAGKTASTLAVARVLRAFRESGEDNLTKRLVEAAESAGAGVFEHSQSHPATAGMATTLVAAAFDGEYCYIVNVGDSRAYRSSGRALLRLTNDHTLVQEQVASGLISAEEAAESPYRHIITRSLGRDPSDAQVESYPAIALEPGTRFILCSDGLTDMVDDDAILALSSAQQPERAARSLVELANRNGGRDNVTVIVIGLEDTAG
jgi:PPM family protein phosphatase